VLSGLRRGSSPPELDEELGIAHCLLPETLDAALAATPAAAAAWIVSPTYFGAAGHVRRLVESRTPTVPLMSTKPGARTIVR